MTLTRRHIFIALLLAFAGFLAVQAVTADTAPKTVQTDTEMDSGATMISIQSYRTDGRLIEVDANGNVNWEYTPTDTRVFDGEYLANGNVLVSVATEHDATDCPDAQLEHDANSCVENRVLELEGDALAANQTKIVWEYSWYDAYISHHEVHDADRLPTGETAIIDMGENRAFTVDQNGTTTWEWDAETHLGEGSAFDDEYAVPPKGGPESDWTHMNDIDYLSNGNFQMSIRNFNVVIEVNPETDEVVDVIGNPTDPSMMHHQHNPQRLSGWNTLIVADSENNRIVEYDLSSGEAIWEYGGNNILNWPRDADRLPNGNTLITDSLNNRVIEINSKGDVVWEYSGVRLPYEADRKSVAEEQQAGAPGWALDGQTSDSGDAVSTIKTIVGWTAYVFPLWVRIPELVAIGGLLTTLTALVVDVAASRVRRGRNDA